MTDWFNFQNIPERVMARIIRQWFKDRIEISFMYNNAYGEHNTYADAKVFKLVRQIRSETELLINANDAWVLYSLVKNTAKISGQIAEVGVYKGGSAKLICETKGDKELYLFDTFEGLPVPSERDPEFKQGDFVSSFDRVKNYREVGRIPRPSGGDECQAPTSREFKDNSP
ncbi:hypothetical protein COT30_02625 [Candidatus Micrarchaeota archaeon CG08_land_8_20_14_0_20_49_17]|nr:MAG: hypothetical protein AUJ13_05545 [Candidatus Micrarchaeota archaeon CG1_02_49_24]PIU09777.1 MAG: hypothetical protein COT30_02625 [Candidatus Micrarchaeota archaeon CG08_land_8_20_14_0_20_49_17]